VLYKIRRDSRANNSVVDVPGWVDQVDGPASVEEPTPGDLRPVEANPDTIGLAPPLEPKPRPSALHLDTAVGAGDHIQFPHEGPLTTVTQVGASEPLTPTGAARERENSLRPVSPGTAPERAEASATAQARTPAVGGPTSADAQRDLTQSTREHSESGPPVPPKDARYLQNTTGKKTTRQYAKKRRNDSWEEQMTIKIDVEDFKNDIVEKHKYDEIQRRNNVRRRYSQGGSDHIFNDHEIALSPRQEEDVVKQAWKRYR